MTHEQLAYECDDFEAAGLAHILLVCPHGTRLPWRGELLSETEANGRVYRVPIKAVRRWLKANPA